MENSSPVMPTQSSPISREVIVVLIILGLICCLSIGLAIGGFFIYNSYIETKALNATATSQFMATKIKIDSDAESTRMAQITATALAKEAAYTNYELYEAFDNNQRQWRADLEDNDFWTGSTSVEDGIYVWTVKEAKQTFMAWGTYEDSPEVSDFDVTVKVKRDSGDPGNACYGIIFRQSPEGFDNGAYTFTVCDDGYYSVNYYSLESEWVKLKDWETTSVVLNGDWNRLSVQARGSKFVCSINEQVVAEVNDTRQASGTVSLYIDFYETIPGTIWFDNFGLQPR